MEKVDVFETPAYTWECPNCGIFNITEKYSDLICDNCHKVFEVGNVSE